MTRKQRKRNYLIEAFVLQGGNDDGLKLLKPTIKTSKASGSALTSQPPNNKFALGETTHTIFNPSSAESSRVAVENKRPTKGRKRNKTTKPRKAAPIPQNTILADQTIPVASAFSHDENENNYIPILIHAERDSPAGRQVFVEWEDYALEEDWTWQLESELAESVPALVQAWRISQDVKPEMFDVEKILDKRNMRGVLHYLVKWKGYDELKDRTWEPSKKLAIDVPGLVEDFEKRRTAKQKRAEKGRKIKKERL